MTETGIKLLAFAASHRPDSYNRKLAHAAAAYAQAAGASLDFAEYAEFDMPVYNDHEMAAGHIPPAAYSFLKRASAAHGIILSSPEYNWSYPGSLKNIIDWTSRLDISLFKNKTALLLCATTGARGGMLALDHLRSPLSALRLQVFNRAFPLGNCQDCLGAQGLTQEKHRKQLDMIVSEFVTFTRKMAN